MNVKYENLLSKGTIGKLEIRNKIVMCPMGMNQSENGYVNDAVINHYKERAKGGVGLILVEVTCVDVPLGKNTGDMLVLSDDKQIPGMMKLVDNIHEHGAKVMLQLSHTGRGARRAVTGEQPVAPSAVAMPYSFMMGLSNEEPRALTIDEIKSIEHKFVDAAVRAQKAGFDGVQLHSAGYYLGQQFLSSQANVRTDEYGGNPENRVRFHLDIVKMIKEKCGEDYPVLVKLSAMESGEDAGITMGDGTYYAKRFQDAGVEAIEIIAGTWQKEGTIEDIPDTGSAKGRALGLCVALKMGIEKMTGAPATIKMIGGVRSGDPAVGEKAIQEGTCDFIFVGKELLTEPNLVNMILEGKQELIKPCIGCGVCIDEQLQGSSRARCSVNAVLGYKDNDYTILPAEKKKKVIVVGGGPGGVEASRICALRGHHVTLYEKNKVIGGQLHYAIAPLYKKNIEPLIEYFKKQLHATGVHTILGKEITAVEIIDQNPDAVVCATGVVAVNLPIEGIENKKVCNARDILDGKKAGEQVVIIGGGVVGCETAQLIASQGKKVTIIEILPVVAESMVNVSRAIILGHLKEYGVEILTETKCEKISDFGVVARSKEGHTFDIEADQVILAVGYRSNTAVYDALQGKVSQLFNIGDSVKPDRICTAVRDGYYSALDI